jgi:hypothetical protein
MKVTDGLTARDWSIASFTQLIKKMWSCMHLGARVAFEISCQSVSQQPGTLEINKNQNC